MLPGSTGLEDVNAIGCRIDCVYMGVKISMDGSSVGFFYHVVGLADSSWKSWKC